MGDLMHIESMPCIPCLALHILQAEVKGWGLALPGADTVSGEPCCSPPTPMERPVKRWSWVLQWHGRRMRDNGQKLK